MGQDFYMSVGPNILKFHYLSFMLAHENTHGWNMIDLIKIYLSKSAPDEKSEQDPCKSNPSTMMRPAEEGPIPFVSNRIKENSTSARKWKL
jgi:hypothetical protein